MPIITIERDARGRDIAVKRGADIVLTISYDANGQVRRLTIGTMTLDFAIQSDGIREVLMANGAVLMTTVAKPESMHQFSVSVSLDPVADRLSLASDWRKSVHVRRSTTGSLVSVSDALSGPIAEIVQLGAMGAAFDTKGAPLFYDLWLKYTATPDLKDGDASADVTTALNGVLPTRLIVPVTGDASAYVQSPNDGAIFSVWTLVGGATPSYRFRVYHDAAKTSATGPGAWSSAGRHPYP